jgi:hypothetical protein
LWGRREGIEEVPDRGTGKTGNDGHVKCGRCLGCPFHLLCSSPPHAFRVTVPPNAVGKNVLVALVDAITDGLSNEMIAYGPHVEIVSRKEIPTVSAVTVVRNRSLNIEMPAPAGQLKSVVSPLRSLFSQHVERHIRPLSGK